jgi:hypothetical protein
MRSQRTHLKHIGTQDIKREKIEKRKGGQS